MKRRRLASTPSAPTSCRREGRHGARRRHHFSSLSAVLDSLKVNDEEKVGVSIVERAIEEPLRSIAERRLGRLGGARQGAQAKVARFDAATEEYEDLVEVRGHRSDQGVRRRAAERRLGRRVAADHRGDRDEKPEAGGAGALSGVLDTNASFDDAALGRPGAASSRLGRRLQARFADRFGRRVDHERRSSASKHRPRSATERREPAPAPPRSGRRQTRERAQAPGFRAAICAAVACRARRGARASLAGLPNGSTGAGYDPFGFDEDVTALPAHGGRVPLLVSRGGSGLEHVPAEGAVFVVADHAGDAFALGRSDDRHGASARGGDAEFGSRPRPVLLADDPLLVDESWPSRSSSGRPSPPSSSSTSEDRHGVSGGGARLRQSCTKAYQLQRFGLGFMRLALEHRVPILPVGIISSEEQSPGLADRQWLRRLVGAPAFPITVTMPWLRSRSASYRCREVSPDVRAVDELFQGDFDADDAELQPKVDQAEEQDQPLDHQALQAQGLSVLLSSGPRDHSRFLASTSPAIARSS